MREDVSIFIGRLNRASQPISTEIRFCGSSLPNYPHPGMLSTNNVDNTTKPRSAHHMRNGAWKRNEPYSTKNYLLRFSIPDSIVSSWESATDSGFFLPNLAFSKPMMVGASETSRISTITNSK